MEDTELMGRTHQILWIYTQTPTEWAVSEEWAAVVEVLLAS